MPHPVRLLRFLYFIYARNFKVYYLIIFNFSEEKDRLYYEAVQPENTFRKGMLRDWEKGENGHRI